MEVRRGTPELLKGIGQGLQINLGDATLLASLETIALGQRAVVIDDNAEAITQILNELKTNKPVFSFLRYSPDQKKMYASIENRVLQFPNIVGKLQKTYKTVWEKAKKNLQLLTIIDASIENVITRSSTPIPIADEITYLYPSALFNPRFKALELASLLLKPDGTFIVISENSDLIRNFHEYAGNFVISSGYKKRVDDRFLSAYDIAWGQRGHFEVVIKNTDGKLSERLNGVKKSFRFRAMSLLGIIK